MGRAKIARENAGDPSHEKERESVTTPRKKAEEKRVKEEGEKGNPTKEWRISKRPGAQIPGRRTGEKT